MYKSIDELKIYICGEIVSATNYADGLKKWRNIFDVSQRMLAKRMGIKSSTLSEYENGKRQNPGIGFIKRYVDALIEIDKEKASKTIKSLVSPEYKIPFQTKEFKSAISFNKLKKDLILEEINGKKVSKPIFGITIIETNELRTLPFSAYLKLFGKNNSRVFVFLPTNELLLIEFCLKFLKFYTGMVPSMVMILDESENALEKYRGIKTNLPLFLCKMNKEALFEHWGLKNA